MTGSRQKHFQTFALYNRWANNRLYVSAEKLTRQQLEEDRGAFFKSVLGTLNHLIVTDRLWMSRVEGESPNGVQLDEILYENFSALRDARTVEDARIIENIYALDEASFDRTLNYATTDGMPVSQPLGAVLAHVFNHQTHHRGQAHDLIGQLIGADRTPVLDLMAYLRTAAANDKP